MDEPLLKLLHPAVGKKKNVIRFLIPLFFVLALTTKHLSCATTNSDLQGFTYILSVTPFLRSALSVVFYQSSRLSCPPNVTQCQYKLGLTAILQALLRFGDALDAVR